LDVALAAAIEQPILDVGNVAFVSHTVGNIAWIPLDPSEWTEEKLQLLQEILEGKPGAVTVGVIASGDDLAIFAPGRQKDTFILPAGTYLAKAQWDEERQEAVGALVDQEGNVVTLTRLLILREEVETVLPAPPFIHTKQVDVNRFMIAVGAEPLSQFLSEMEAKLNAPPNPIVVVIVITINISVRGALVGAMLGGCLFACR
jgi:hypothetical protein